MNQESVSGPEELEKTLDEFENGHPYLYHMLAFYNLRWDWSYYYFHLLRGTRSFEPGWLIWQICVIGWSVLVFTGIAGGLWYADWPALAKWPLFGAFVTMSLVNSLRVLPRILLIFLHPET